MTCQKRRGQKNNCSVVISEADRACKIYLNVRRHVEYKVNLIRSVVLISSSCRKYIKKKLVSLETGEIIIFLDKRDHFSKIRQDFFYRPATPDAVCLVELILVLSYPN